MSVPTVNVTCTASDQNGQPVAFARYIAKLNQTEIYQGFVAPEQVEVTANAAGVAVLALFPNALGVAGSLYTVKAFNPDTGKRFLDTAIAVPNVACNLHEILVQEPYPAIDAAQQALIGSQAAQAEAQASELAAAASEAAAAASEASAAEDAIRTATDRAAVAADSNVAIYNEFQAAFVAQATSLINTQNIFVQNSRFT